VKEAAPVVSVVSIGAANTDFYTLIAPRNLSAPLPQFLISGNDPLVSDHIRVEGVGSNFKEVDELTWHTGTEPDWRRTS